ncbi:MAG: TetR/AcrR family transcriptional regulator, partial [Acidimicrobiia bacterium]|nr:TetR/AcrR family transcriptional regulator [Acidimicrobiia bacterium]
MDMQIRPGARKIAPMQVARMGAAVVRRDGADRVSMRKVADRLGVTPMALYRCFDSSEDLRLASVSCALERIPDPPAGGSVRDRLREWARVARP